MLTYEQNLFPVYEYHAIETPGAYLDNMRNTLLLAVFKIITYIQYVVCKTYLDFILFPAHTRNFVYAKPTFGLELNIYQLINSKRST